MSFQGFVFLFEDIQSRLLYFYGFDERRDQFVVVYGFYTAFRFRYDLGKNAFDFLGDNADFVGSVALFQFIIDAVDLFQFLDGISDRPNVFLDPDIGIRRPSYRGDSTSVSIHDGVSARHVAAGGFASGSYPSGRADAAVDMQLARRGRHSDSDVSVGEDGHVRGPSRSVIGKEIDFSRRSSDRVTSDVDVPAAVVRSVNGVRTVKQTVSSVVRTVVPRDERTRNGRGSEIFSYEAVSHCRNVSVHAQFRIGCHAYPHVPS